MDIKITINTDNAAFEDYPHVEVARILHKMANSTESDGCLLCVDNYPVMDINGNTVGLLNVKA